MLQAISGANAPGSTRAGEKAMLRGIGAALATLLALSVTAQAQAAGPPHTSARPPALIASVRVTPTSAVNGRQATLTVRTHVGAICRAQIVYPRRQVEDSRALQVEERSYIGSVEWKWNLRSRLPGTSVAVVRCQRGRTTQRATTQFRVVADKGPYQGITVRVERFYRDPHPDLYSRPPAGFNVYVARVQITNAGTRPYPYLEVDFKLRGPDLSTYDPLMGYFHLTLGSGVARPGDTITGNLIYTARPGQQFQFLWMAPYHAPILVLPLPAT